ncbi:GNAT family N-acetyltransferase [Pelagibacterium nitratireducens]|uniref:GNAT family N-acetyltransferase n=1 Tax=Pelagibacterium nitratireducens TaxID=1046114 RepID=A0ABZ2I125_9HYPH|tara:strand:+ start:943 stop:1464 length:522 start_codon:yes stop_codon:yes gene_type:complete
MPHSENPPQDRFDAAPVGDVRNAEMAEIEHLAGLWHSGWQDAHAAILPAELSRYRTPASFRQRIIDNLALTRVSGPLGNPSGLCMIKHDELYQLFVAPAARGSGTAAALLADGERRIAASQITTAWLACAIGNERAARFYEKHGWKRAGQMTNRLPTPDGIFELEVWRYEKRL